MTHERTRPFFPTAPPSGSRARADLRMGVPVVIAAGTSGARGAGRRNRGPDRVAALRALGEPVVAITRGAPARSRRAPMTAIWRGS
jgi:hypothetical protein